MDTKKRKIYAVGPVEKKKVKKNVSWMLQNLLDVKEWEDYRNNKARKPKSDENMVKILSSLMSGKTVIFDSGETPVLAGLDYYFVSTSYCLSEYHQIPKRGLPQHITYHRRDKHLECHKDNIVFAPRREKYAPSSFQYWVVHMCPIEYSEDCISYVLREYLDLTNDVLGLVVAYYTRGRLD